MRITVNYKFLNALVDLDGQPLRRVDGILNSLYKDKVFSIFDLNSAFIKSSLIQPPFHLRPSAPPPSCSSCSRMPQGANAAPSWFVKAISNVVQRLQRVLSCLDDIVCFD